MTSTAAGGPLEIRPLRGAGPRAGARIVCPPDKSITHRSVIFAAMAKGESRISSPLLGADCRSTMGAFRALGVEIDIAADEVVVRSPGIDQWRSPLVPLDYGNSGTTARLLTGLFAARPGLFVTAFGDASLTQRPMGRVVEPLRKMGAEIQGRDGARFLPLSQTGRELRAASHVVDKATAQVKSALVLAGLSTAGTTTVELPAGSRDHTEKMLAALGAKLEARVKGQGMSALETVAITGPFRPAPQYYRVPGDPSSAAFFAVLASVAREGALVIESMLDNPTRTGFLTALLRMGAKIDVSKPRFVAGLLEPVIDLTVQGGGELIAIDLEPELAPTLIDEIPILAVAALFSKGTSRLRGLAELRIKESDRLAKTVELLAAVGGQATIEGDDLLITGDPRRREAGLQSFHFAPDGDHRLAMAAAILAKFAKATSTIDDPECVDVSFPRFFDLLEQWT